MKKTLSIVVPTYNENENVALLIEKVDAALKGIDYEILFVDDNSRDGTPETITSLSSKYPVRVMVRKDKRGLASAVVDGIKQGDSEYVIVMDADLQHPPEILPAIVKSLQTNDFVMGSRYAKGGSPGEWKLTRKIVSFVANLLALPLVPKIKDRVSGLFGFRREALDVNTLSPVGWKIGLEIAVRGKYKSMTEVPYTFLPRAKGSSKLSRKIIWQYVQQLVGLYFARYQVINFMIVGGIGAVINLVVYWLLLFIPALKNIQWDWLGKNKQNYLLPFIISTCIAIVSNYYMNRAWTFKGWKEQNSGLARYMVMGLGTFILDCAILVFFVRFHNFPYVPSAALAILIAFVVRFLIARTWVWSDKTRR